MVRTGATVADAVAEWLRYVEHDRAVKPSTLPDYRHTGNRIARDRRRPWSVRGTGSQTISRRIRRRRFWALVRPAGSDQDAALYLAAAFTGLRMGELLALQGRDIDYSGEAIRVRRSYNVHGGVGSPKSGKVRSVPMVPDVAERLARLAGREFWVEPEDLVFANELGTFQDASSIRIRYRAALTRAGLRQLRFHDLCHTFGTLAVRRAEVPAVQAWMGTATSKTTMRYVHHRDRGDEANVPR
jgi:integrase